MIVEAISRYLSTNKIKQKDLAAQIGVSKQTICTTLAGKRKLMVDEYVKICDALKLNYSYFFANP